MSAEELRKLAATTTADAVFKAICERGFTPMDGRKESDNMRDAVHEANHALQQHLTGYGRQRWTRKNIDKAVQKERRANAGVPMLRAAAWYNELECRAVEQLVCAALGAPCYSVEQGVFVATREANEFGELFAPFDASVAQVRKMMEEPRVLNRARRVIQLACDRDESRVSGSG
jgi:hypothetical protein